MKQFWLGRRCFVTGHTGFKGAWLCAMLSELGAEVSGYALAPTPAQEPLDAAVRGTLERSVYGDVRDEAALGAALREARPEVLFHLAAQPLVLRGYAEPVETFDVNVLGTARVLEAARAIDGLGAIVVVTSDKCYRNDDRRVARVEDDPLGGRDPYSASKACAELVAACYDAAFFSREGSAVIATARAGNVVGGGDLSDDRIVPDIVRSARDLKPLTIRSPHAVRPWQHVLDALHGYLLLARGLMLEPERFRGAWNFGPRLRAPITVRRLAELTITLMHRPVPIAVDPDADDAPHEARYLDIDPSRAERELGWTTMLDVSDTLSLTADWYGAWLDGGPVAAITEKQIRYFLERTEARDTAESLR